MKKSLLSLLLILCFSAFASAQVVFSVEPPSANAGGYTITYADVAGGDWGSPDMLDPANVVQGIMCLAQDSLACEALTNGADLVGKVAVVYRGACEFGSKALACQDEGAIACIIINHSGDPVEMGGGADGLAVTIPVIMISTVTGAVLHDEIAECTTNVTIGNLNGFFANNMRITPGGIIRPASAGVITALSLDDTEFDIAPGAWVYNFGTEEESNAVLNMTVGFEGAEIYNESSDGETILAGDSLYVTLPAFTQSSYANGLYTNTYTISGTGEDQANGDNEVNANFTMGNTLSYARLSEDGTADPVTFTRANELIGEGNYCIYFSDPNASRVQLTAFDFTGTLFEAEEELADRDMEVVAYIWEDEYLGLDTQLATFSEEDSEGYSFQVGDDDLPITVTLSNPIDLQDDEHYLFCIRHEDPLLAFGYDNQTHYDQTAIESNTPVNPSWDGADGFVVGFGLNTIPSISVRLVEPLGLDEANEAVELTPYPNPANETLTIPLTSDLRGQALMSIFNTEGKVVSQETINLTGSQLLVDITTISNGTYLFDLQFEGQKESTFSVVINR